jgi:F-type H+-transporting ATPase subunit b
MLTATVMFAGSGHGTESDAQQDGHHFNWIAFLGKLFNSTVLFGGLIFFLRKPIINWLSQKSLEVKTDIVQRETQLNGAQENLEGLKSRLSKIEEELITIKENAKKSGLEEDTRIKELAEQEVERIKQLTDAEILTRIDNAKRNLKAHIADLTVDHFKKDIQGQLDKKTHNKIIEKNIDICGDIIERE